jgi:hypothetical protein
MGSAQACGIEREEVTGDWKMRRAEHVACIGKKIEAYRKGREEKGRELSINVRTIWTWISKK